MAPRVRGALLIITALVLVAGVLMGGAMPNDASPAGTSLVRANDPAPALVAVQAKSLLRVVLRGLPQATMLLAVVAAVRFSARRRSMPGLLIRLGDVGDRWRALLFGAPPSLL